MKISHLAAAVFLTFATAASAQGWREPPAGSAEAGALLEVFRPVAESELATSLSFDVVRLRVSEGIAYGVLVPQAKDGGAILWEETLVYSPDYVEAVGPFEGTPYEVYFRLGQDNMWSVAAYQFGGSEPLFASAEICAEFQRLLLDILPAGNCF